MKTEELLSIDPDIRKAKTLATSFYTDPRFFEATKESIFAESWQYLAPTTSLPDKGFATPFSLLKGLFDEPLLLTRGFKGQLHCLSNVCTHRGNTLIEKPTACHELKCRYHGRRFHLNGGFKSMSEFKEIEDFPLPEDDLARLPLRQFGNLLFTSLSPSVSFEDYFDVIKKRIPWIPLEKFEHHPEHDRIYDVNAHWALYCDNYLEGFHIPFVHKGLNDLLQYSEYQYELYPYANLQLGIAREGESHFDIPPSSPDYGKKVAAYYFWVFPNLMLNFYPYGLSLNVVEPVSPTQTRIHYQTFVWKKELFSEETLRQTHATEIEDEEIVEQVQRGMHSRFYKAGRYSPKMEVGVHQFHRLIVDSLSLQGR